MDDFFFDSPIGVLLLTASKKGVTDIKFSQKGLQTCKIATGNQHLQLLRKELRAYLSGELTTRTLSLSLSRATGLLGLTINSLDTPAGLNASVGVLFTRA